MTTAKKPDGIIVSQSMMKDVKRYFAKLMCGFVLKAKYIDKTWPEDADDSPAKALGRYFEYILTGAVPRSGITPEPIYKKGAMKAFKRDPLRNRLKVEHMTKEYQLAHRNAERVKKYFKIMKIRILEVNVHYLKGLKEGTIDIIAMYKGRRVVIDVKYSGLLDDKWNELGWAWTDEQAKFHGTQALQYHDLTKLEFYFLIVSSTNEEEIKFLEVQFDDFSREQHEKEVNKTRKEMEFMVEFGFNPRPELVRCSKCAIREGCQAKIEAPQPEKVWLVSNE